MKHSLALLTLVGASSLLADDCCTPCTPCCEPKPRAPINCECYTPAFDDMQCDWGVFVTVDFLYWYGRENDLCYSVHTETVFAGNASLAFDDPGASSVDPFYAGFPTKFKHLDAEWDPGVRVGLGWKMCDGWDLYADWTYYSTERKHSDSVAPFALFPDLGQEALINPWADQSLLIGLAGAQVPGNALPFIAESIHAKWSLRFDQVDLEIGRKYWLSKCFAMRPFVGLRGAWTSARFDVTGETNQTFSAAVLDYKTSDKFHNKNWGVGLLAGFQPVFYMTSEFSLFGEAGFALLWGDTKSKVNRHYLAVITATSPTDNQNIEVDVGAPDNYFDMQPVLDLALGLRWETSWCQNRYAFALDAGWEHHIWFDYYHRAQPLGTIAISNRQLSIGPTAQNYNATAKFNEVITHLSMGGLVVRARFDF